MTLNHTKKRIRETLNGFVGDVAEATSYDELFDILENIIDQASMYLDDVNEAMDEREEEK